MTQQLRVVVLGYGEMGHAMEYLLKTKSDQGVQFGIWDRYPKEGLESVVLENAIPQADVVCFCLPVNPHREIAERIAPLMKKGCICLSIAKGLDEDGKTAAQIFADVFGSKFSYALMYGPMISEEIREGRYAFAQLACVDVEEHAEVDTCSTIMGLFRNTGLYLEFSSDIPGITWSVILKNVYAIVFGIADELKLGDNMRGYLAATAFHELEEIVGKLGGSAGICYQLAGLGDLITTATSEDSHHHELGCMLARGETEGIQGEGIHTLEMVIKHQLFKHQVYPLFQLINRIVENPYQVEKQINEYLEQAYS